MTPRRITLLPSSMVALLLLALLAGAANPARGENDSHIIRLDNVSLSALDGLNLHPRLALDYGTFLWLDVSGADLARVQSSGLVYQEQVDPYLLRLGERNVDLASAAPLESSTGPDLYLVQFAGPTRTVWLDSLRANGLSIVQYIHPFTYVVWGEAKALQAAAALPVVHATGVFAPEYRLLPAYRSLPEAVIRVNMMLYRGADSTVAIQQIEALGGQDLGRMAIDATFEIAQFNLSSSQLQEASRIPAVYSIQPVPTSGGLRGEMSDQINAGNYDETNLAIPGYPEWLDSVGVDGAGVIIANVDGGVDNNHVDLVSRFVPCVGQTCGGSEISYHGTHTAGIMAADGSSGTRDSHGFLRGLGMAPGANLVEQVYSPWFTQPGGMLLLMTESYRNGASLSGNSWGPSGYPMGYDDDTRQVDVGVRDADPDALGDQPFSFILSIMNGGGGYQTQGTPDEAKNIFTIGSTWMQESGGQILNIDDLSSNTAHGPALDGRKIPHMVAPGCDVDSTVPGGYDLMCGTSMASPHVSGAVALFIEYYRNLMGIDPSPALIKAAYLPVAHDLAGHLDADGNILGHPFDAKQGWGRMNTADVISPSMEAHYFDNPLLFDNTGEEWIQTLFVADPTKPLKIMLVWTDAPGHGLGGSTPAWNNDLDLVAIGGGHTYRGNAFDDQGWSLPDDATADGMNNTEGVFLGPTASGSVTVHVIASNIDSDGVPGMGDDTDQDFALVCYNCASKPDFHLTVQPETQALCAPVRAVYTTTVESLVGFNELVTLSVQGAPSESTVSFSLNPVLPTENSILTIDNPLTVTAGSYALVISGVSITYVHTATLGLDLNTILPDVPELLFPAAEARNVSVHPTFSWQEVEQGRLYDLQAATDAAFTNIIISASGLTSTSFTPDGDLPVNTVLYWRVMAHNICGDSTWSDTRRFLTETTLGQCALGTTPEVLLSEGFESITLPAGWATDGIGSTWASSLSRTHSGVRAFKGKDVDTVSDQWLITPAVILPSNQNPLTFSFWGYRKFQLGGCYDGGVLEISNDGGATWSALDTQIRAGDYEGTISSPSNPLFERDGWCVASTDWLNTLVVLDEFAGQTVQFRFRLGTDDAIGYEGWAVDDVSMQACKPSISLGPDSSLQALPGESVTHYYVLANQSTATDSFALAVVGGAWPTTLVSASPITLTPGATATVSVRVDVPVSYASLSDSFSLSATSLGILGITLQANGETSLNFQPAVDFSAAQASGAQVGQVVAYVFTLTNAGNYTDTFTLAASGDWSAILPGGASSGPLGAGESVTVTLLVEIPESALPADTDVTVLTATSSLDASVSGSVNATTAVFYSNYLPVVKK